MSPEKYWNCQLTHQGRRKALAAVGRALGYQYPSWRDLPLDLRRQLRGLWNSRPANPAAGDEYCDE